MSVNEYEKELDSDHEVGARLVSFGADIAFHIEDVGYLGPDMIIFYGVSHDGKKIQLLQHVSQFSFLLVAANKVNENARRIDPDLTQKLNKGPTEAKIYSHGIT